MKNSVPNSTYSQRTRLGTAGKLPFVCEQRPVSQHLTRLSYSALLDILYTDVLFLTSKKQTFLKTSLSPNSEHKFEKKEHTDTMGLIFFRTAIIFIALLSIMRLMGKRQIGEMQPFELVITLLIAELACIPMADSSIPLLYGIISILTIFLLHQLILLLGSCFKPFKTIISGKPSVVINRDGIDISQLKKNSLDLSDLIESVRAAGYFSLDEIQYAVYEANGQFTAVPNTNIADNTKSTLPILIADNGKYDKHNLSLTKMTKESFDSFLIKNGIRSIRKVFVMTLDNTGKIYLQCKKDHYKIFQITLPEGCSW